MLVKVGALLESIVRTGDTVARIGGDEFAILIADVRDRHEGVEFADRIVSVLHEAVEFEGEQSGISISVGVAFADSTTAADQLISEADAAMHEAKTNRRNHVEVFESSMRARLVERLEFTSRFRGSLDRSEFFLDFQPIFSLGDRHLRGFEALVRWQHPTIGLVAPLDFIPVAEETGFIVPLGRWILFEACRADGGLERAHRRAPHRCRERLEATAGLPSSWSTMSAPPWRSRKSIPSSSSSRSPRAC